MSDIIKKYINEVLRGFNLGKFKSVSASHSRPEEPETNPNYYTTSYPEVEYAQQHLPLMGKGSSRITFALSSNKALKIALNEAGISQNKQEVNSFIHYGQTGAIAEIFDYDVSGKWIIAEILRPFSSTVDFKKYAGFPFDQIYKIEAFTRSSSQTWEQFIEQEKYRILMDIKFYEEDNREAEKRLERAENLLRAEEADNDPSHSKIYARRELRFEIDDLQRSILYTNERIEEEKDKLNSLEKEMKNAIFINFANKLKALVKLGFEFSDLHDPHQFGVDFKGNVKILDYGLNRDVYFRHYTK